LVELAPTKEEEFLLLSYRGEASKLNTAERFLKAVLEVPFAMKRIEVILYQARFEANINHLQKSLQTLQVNIM
jgi:Formin Homology 2 Domain